jgi:ABC-type sugar transport system ATPase subunit
VFENYALYPNMTVFENLAFPLKAPARAVKLRTNDIKTRVREIAQTLGIESLVDRRTSQLSGGQKQRVALGRALIRQPDVFLMDEPISHLDAKLRFEMRAELKRLQRDIGITTLYATPDYAEAMALADVIAVLQDGRVVQVGSPSTVFKQPVNIYVAHLLGEPHINLLEMDIQSTCCRHAAVAQGIQFELHPSQAVALQRQQINRLVVGVRPSDLFISPLQQGHDSVSAIVIAVEPRGATTVVVIEAGGNKLVAKIRGQQTLQPGSCVWITARSNSLYFFKLNTGERIEVPLVEKDDGATR